ncbi:MAG: SDR family NAD(P)-dependent oxidoreductase [Pseudomonadota bacterium]
MPNSDDRPVILVTGASRGIGRSVALEVARRGMHPICIARTQGALEALDDEIKDAGGQCTLIAADLTDREMMSRLPEALVARYGKLDGFVANAGLLGDLTPVSDIQPKDWDRTMALNVTANVQLFGLLDPLLRAAPAARVVGITSGRARKAAPFWATYCATKAAFAMVVDCYALETAETNIRTNLVDPGPIRTGMREKAMPGEDPETLPHPDELAPLIADLLSPEETRNGETVSFREWRS